MIDNLTYTLSNRKLSHAQANIDISNIDKIKKIRITQFNLIEKSSVPNVPYLLFKILKVRGKVYACLCVKCTCVRNKKRCVASISLYTLNKK